MKNLYNHKNLVRKCLAVGLGLSIAAFALTACDDENTVQPPLQSPVATCTESTWRSLSFEWEKVSGAVQYSYILKDAEENVIYGEVTTGNTGSVDWLDSDTPYTLYIYAYPVIGGDASPSECVTLQMRTGLINLTGSYESGLVTRNTTWNAELEEKELNSFVMKNWYGVEGYDLEFTVNPADSTINVLNGEIDEATGLKNVPSGNSGNFVRKGVLVDGTQSKFDRLGCLLTLKVRATTGNKENEDTFTWE